MHFKSLFSLTENLSTSSSRPKNYYSDDYDLGVNKQVSDNYVYDKVNKCYESSDNNSED